MQQSPSFRLTREARDALKERRGGKNGRVFSDDYAHRYLCHYTSREAFLSYILPSLRLRMSRFRNVNDPRESRQWVCTLMVPDDLMGAEWDVLALSSRFTDHMKSNAKLLCVTRDDPDLAIDRSSHMYGRAYAHPSMWDRYGGQHGGVCLMLDAKELHRSVELASSGRGELFSGPVAYADQPATESAAYTLWANTLNDQGETTVFDQHQRDHREALYFSKASDWASEFEYRWVLLDGSDDDVYVDIGNCLRGVVLGEDFPPAAADMVALLLQQRDIDLSRIKYRNGHPIVLPHPSTSGETDSVE